MDPSKTFDELSDANREKRWDDSWHLADDLREWLLRGGFAPHGFDRDGVLELCDQYQANAESFMNDWEKENS